MPEISPLIVFLLIAGFSWFRRKVRQAAEEARRSQEAARKAAMPQHKAAAQGPAVSGQGTLSARHLASPTVPSISSSEGYDPAGKEKYTPRFELPDEVDPIQEMLAKKPALQTAASQSPRPGILPVLQGSSIVQAVILKEILTRPASARSRYGGFRRRAGSA